MVTLKTVAPALGCLAIGMVIVAIALSSDSGGDFATSKAGAEPRPLYCPKDDESGYDATDLIGRITRAARAQAREAGCSVRIITRDGRGQLVTDDLDVRRINVVTKDGRITRVVGIF